MQYVVTFKGMNGEGGILPQQNILLSFPHEVDVLHVEQSKGRTSLPIYSVDVTRAFDAVCSEMKCEPVDVVIARLHRDDYFCIYKQSEVPKEQATEIMRLTRDEIKSQFSSYLSNVQMADLLKEELYRKHQILISLSEAEDGIDNDPWLIQKRQWDNGLELVSPIEQGKRIGQMLLKHPTSTSAFKRATHLLMTLASNGTWMQNFQRVCAFAKQFDENPVSQVKPFALYLEETIGDYQTPEWIKQAIVNITCVDGSEVKARASVPLLSCYLNEECENGQFVSAFISFIGIALKIPSNYKEKLLARMSANTI